MISEPKPSLEMAYYYKVPWTGAAITLYWQICQYDFVSNNEDGYGLRVSSRKDKK